MNGLRLERVGISCGLISPFLFISLYVVAVLLDPSYVLGSSYLSELGVGPAAWAFNGALVLSGLLIPPFVLLDLKNLGGLGAAKASRGVLAISGAGMVGAGLWTMDTLVLHAIAALVGFAALTIGQILFLTVLLKNRAYGIPGTVVTAAALSFSILLLASGVDPLWETVGALAAFVWLLTVASMEARWMASRGP